MQRSLNGFVVANGHGANSGRASPARRGDAALGSARVKKSLEPMPPPARQDEAELNVRKPRFLAEETALCSSAPEVAEAEINTLLDKSERLSATKYILFPKTCDHVARTRSPAHIRAAHRNDVDVPAALPARLGDFAKAALLAGARAA